MALIYLGLQTKNCGNGKNKRRGEGEGREMFFFHGNRTPLLDLDWPTSYKFKFEEVDWLNRILTGREKGWEGGAGDLVMFPKKGYSYG